MNERMRKLAEEAGIIHAHMSVGEIFDALQKFEKGAELIVRQTMDYASRNWEHGHLLAEDLKVYFGVE